MPPKSSAVKRKNIQEKVTLPDEKLSKVDVSTSDPRTIVLMLDSPELNVISKACEALHKYLEISETNIFEVMELGAIPKMLKLISSPDKIARCHAILCLCVMATQPSVRRLLYKSDFIPALLKLLQPDEEQITQERASFMLTLLAAEYSFKVLLGNNDVHKPLLALTQSMDPDIQRNSIQVLCQLMESFQLRPAVFKDDGLPLIIKLLDSEYAIIQEMALQTLCSCVHHAPSRQVVAGGEGISKLVALLGDKDCTDLHVLAVEVLGLCLEDTDSMSILQGSGCLQQLLCHITESTNQQMKKHTTNTLASAASNTLNRKILHESQVENTFVQLLTKEDGEVVEAICALFSNMAVLNSSRQLIGREGGVGELVKHLKGSNAVRAAAVHCLAYLLQESPSNCKVFAEHDGIKALVPLFLDSQAVCRHFAAECIISIACDESLRKAVIAADKAVASMVGCLSFQDSLVQASTAQALGMLACDQSVRQQVCINGGLQPLLHLLQSSNKEVVRKGIWMLMVCAQCPQVAGEACKHGAIPLVSQIAASGDHQCATMAKCALERLFGANLPAKYWVTGTLDMTDSLVNTEFYDAGPAYSNSPFLSLSELIQQPLKKSQPIITVNLLVKIGNGVGPTPTSVVPPTTTVNEDGPPTTQIDDGQSTTSISSGSRKGSRMHTSRLKKVKAERESESRISQDLNEDNNGGSIKLPGQLEVDQGLWDQIQHAIATIKPLPSTTQQFQELAKYVANRLGGPVERSGPLCFELLAGQKQIENLLPLGELQQGSFQHRALLYKVICDSIGLPCSLVRGMYSRHWNVVSVCAEETSVGDTTKNKQENSVPAPIMHPPDVTQSSTPHDNASHTPYLVDLMFDAGTLLPLHSPQAVQYQHLI